jgi:ABC-type glycerol-3-phosphate transport system substrate-binding protein
MKTKILLIGLAMSASLAACGGGSDGQPVAGTTSTSDVPASATASATSYSLFVKSLAASETGQPLNVESVTPPSSETDAPVSL